MTGARATRGRIVYLDGLRGVAILTVFGVHWARHQAPVFTGGYIGVDIFFVLSGFIITELLVRRPPTYKAFIFNRVRRLYPPLLGVLVFGTAIIGLWPRSGVPFTQCWHAAFVAGAQLTSPFMATGHNELEPFVITWSLAVEWYFYLAWPFVVRALTRLPRQRAAGCLALTAVLLYVASLATSASWFYFGPVARFGEMAAGGALAFWAQAGRTSKPALVRPLAWVALFFLGAWTLFGPDVYSWAYRIVGLPCTTICAVSLIAAGLGGATHPVVSLLEWRPLVWVGEISYTLYLWHTLPIALIPGDWYGLPTPALAAIGLSIMALATWAGYVWLEKPFRRSRSTDLQVSDRPVMPR